MDWRARVVVLIIAGGLALYILRLLRHRNIQAKYSLIWLGSVGGLVVFAAWPLLVDELAGRLGISYPPALFFGAALAGLFAFAVYQSFEMSRLEERTRVLAEEIGILTVEAAKGEAPRVEADTSENSPDGTD